MMVPVCGFSRTMQLLFVSLTQQTSASCLRDQAWLTLHGKQHWFAMMDAIIISISTEHSRCQNSTTH